MPAETPATASPAAVDAPAVDAAARPTASAASPVRDAALRASKAAPSLAAAGDAVLDAALRAIARHLKSSEPDILAANADDVTAAKASGMTDALLDRLRVDAARLQQIAEQLDILAGTAHPVRRRPVRELPGGFVVEEWRRPVGVIGANFEARPNVVVDIASQLVKSRNAGVLRTGSAAIGSAAALLDRAVGPALDEVGLDPDAVQLVRQPGRESAYDLVRHADLVPLVILRGSGDSTRQLAREAAMHDVRTLAHADGGGVLYLDRSADLDKALALIEASLDRLGVCNRLNLLLISADRVDEWREPVHGLLDKLGIQAAAPQPGRSRGYEWALDDGNEATVTVDVAADPVEAARIANSETSGLAAGIVTEDSAAAQAFLTAYQGTGAFWNATTRLLDGFKLLAIPETGINIDRVPGPRGPVTFHDLYLRQFVVTEGSSRDA